MLIPGYNLFGGQHYETAPLQQALAYAGLVAPHTGQPFSEDMLFGLGEGLGLTYFAFEFGQTASIYIGTRYHLELQRPACQRLGLKVTVRETTGLKGAEKHLKEALATGQPVIAWTDRASLPYYALSPEKIKYYYHCVLVYGFDEAADRVNIADRSTTPLTVTPAELAFSRAAITAQKNRMLTVEPPSQGADLTGAIYEAIRSNTKYMLEPPIANFGLKALPKWADLLTNAKDKKSWPRIFPQGKNLYHALKSIFEYIWTYADGGGDFRAMYSRFLEEAAAVTGRPEFKETTAHYRELGAAWQDFAKAALPESIPLFKETRDLLIRHDELFLEKGMAAHPEMMSITERLTEIPNEIGEDFPMTQAEVDDLLADLRQRLLKLQEAEADGVYQLTALAAKPA